MELLLSFVQLIGVLLLLGLATERGTQLVNALLLMFTSNAVHDKFFKVSAVG